jgi:1-acyl-sn-glycerol-3-phosphate acyltransferase
VALNSGLYWPPSGVTRRPGRIVVEFLPPIEPGLDKKAFLAELEARIETASDALLPGAERPAAEAA